MQLQARRPIAVVIESLLRFLWVLNYSYVQKLTVIFSYPSRFLFCGVEGSFLLISLSWPFLFFSFTHPSTYYRLLFLSIYIYSMSTEIRITVTALDIRLVNMHWVMSLKSVSQLIQRLISGVEYLIHTTSWLTLWYNNYDTTASVATSNTKMITGMWSVILSE